MSIDPIAAVQSLWDVTRTVNSLYDGVTGKFDNASDRIKGLEFSIEQYRKTFQDLQSILKKEQKTPEGYDGFVQTLRECDNFLESYNSLQNGKAFGAKPKLSPMVLFHSFRYVYADKDIARLEGRIVLQMTTINAVINMIIAKNLADSAGTRTSGLLNIKEEGGTLGQTHWQPSKPPDDLNVTSSNHEDVEELYDTVGRIRYRLKRVGPQAQNIRSSTQALQIDGAEVQRVSEVLRGRLLRNEPQALPNSNPEISGENDFLETSQERLKLLLTNESDLLRFSQERLKTLLSASRNQTALPIRIRVYGPDSETFSLPQPAIADNGALSSATIYIPDTDLPPFELHSIDIVNDGGMRYVVCTEKSMRKGIIHCLPRVENLYPFTKHRNISPKLHDKEVSILESSTVDITGDEKGSFSNVRPLYSFGQHIDMIAFQSALRGNFRLTRTFDVETVKAKTADLASSTHLKVWIDGDGIQSFTFYGNKLEPMRFLEFEISSFEPKIQKKGNNNTLLLTFRLPSKTKKKSRGFSISSLRRTSSADKQIADHPNSRPSVVSTNTLQEAPLSSSIQNLGIALQHLRIEFSSSGEMKKFQNLFSSIHEKLNLPIELPIPETSPSFQDSFRDHFQQQQETFGGNPQAESDSLSSPATSPGTISSYAGSVSTSNASFRSMAPSFTTSVPSEYSRRASSIINRK